MYMIYKSKYQWCSLGVLSPVKSHARKKGPSRKADTARPSEEEEEEEEKSVEEGAAVAIAVTFHL